MNIRLRAIGLGSVLAVLPHCGPAPGPGALMPGTVEIVEGMRDYRSPRDVPQRFTHLVTWQADAEPVVLLFAASGRRACAITQREAHRVLVGGLYRCPWRVAR